MSFAAAVCSGTAARQAPKTQKLEKFPPGEDILWQDPGDVASLDFVYGVGGPDHQPQPPFFFISEDMSGSNPKINVKDANDVVWNIKWGKEAHSDTFGTRMAWACGFIAETEYFIPHGQIRGIDKPLKRAGSEIQGDGYFASGRFQLRSDSPKFLKDAGWSWVNNPFRGTPQINGLKVLMMLVSDWDNKDARDIDRDSNLAIFQKPGDNGPQYLYFIADWGGSMGRWGKYFTRDKWDAKGFSEQTPEFVKGSRDGYVEWGYVGQRTEDQVRDIRVADVQWLMQYLGKITDDQIRKGLAASGATPNELQLFATSLRDRINQLQRVAGTQAPTVQIPTQQ